MAVRGDLDLQLDAIRARLDALESGARPPRAPRAPKAPKTEPAVEDPAPETK